VGLVASNEDRVTLARGHAGSPAGGSSARQLAHSLQLSLVSGAPTRARPVHIKYFIPIHHNRYF
jgi:hypothetical protein